MAHDAGSDVRLTRILAELRKGFAFLETFACDKVVTIFGSARTKRGTKYYKMAEQLGEKLSKEGMTVITGGGPGIMEAANKGASKGDGRSVGINIYLPNGERRNQYIKESAGLYYFFNRKLMLAYSAEAYVYFPGGYGTLDELFEILNLVITKKITKKIPIVLVDRKFWLPLMEWMKKTLIKEGTLSKKNLEVFTIVDSVQEAFDIVKACHKEVPRSEQV